jgi:hypothetical protein
VVIAAGCASSPGGDVPEALGSSDAAILQLPRAASVDCRIETLDALTGDVPSMPAPSPSRIALAPGRYRLVLSCARDVGTWWTPTGVETRHRFELAVEASRSYLVEMRNAAAGVLKWSEIGVAPMVGTIREARSGATVAVELPAQ